MRERRRRARVALWTARVALLIVVGAGVGVLLSTRFPAPVAARPTVVIPGVDGAGESSATTRGRGGLCGRPNIGPPRVEIDAVQLLDVHPHAVWTVRVFRGERLVQRVRLARHHDVATVYLARSIRKPVALRIRSTTAIDDTRLHDQIGVALVNPTADYAPECRVPSDWVAAVSVDGAGFLGVDR